jgi:hypothetical protein
MGEHRMKLTSWIRAWLSEGQDTTLRVTGIRQVYSGYDWEKALAGARRARKTAYPTRQPKSARAPEPNVRPFKVVR